jgi:hypothetical protein
VDLPMPDDAPVTTIVLPSRRLAIVAEAMVRRCLWTGLKDAERDGRLLNVRRNRALFCRGRIRRWVFGRDESGRVKMRLEICCCWCADAVDSCDPTFEKADDRPQLHLRHDFRTQRYCRLLDCKPSKRQNVETQTPFRLYRARVPVFIAYKSL